MSELRTMYMSDLSSVVKIIHQHDEDDAQSARTDYQDQGVENQFVLEIDDKVIGVTGYREVDATDGTYWLSWTYLDAEYQRKGYGKMMLNELLEKLREKKARKLFVKVSDYEDPDDGKIYERAMEVYAALGFVEEVVSNDFYDEGENQHILSLELHDQSAQTSEDEIHVVEEKPVIRFNGLYEIADTDGAYAFSWEVLKTKKLFGKRNFTTLDLRVGIDTVKEQGGRKIFLTFPSNLPLIHTPLQAAGFKYVGQLSDYYEQGVHELHFTHDLSGT